MTWDDHLPFDGMFNSLSIAIAMGHDQVVRVIEPEVWTRIDRNPDLLNAATDSGQTTLYYAAVQGHMTLVRDLLRRGADADPPIKSGHRAIHAVLDGPIDDALQTDADSAERCDLAKLLIEHGANYDLWIAASLGDVARTKELLAQDRSLAGKHYRPDKRGFSSGFPLVRASYGGHREIVALLLDHGADVRTKLGGDDPRESSYALMAAVYGKQWSTVQLLLDRGAQVTAHAYCAPNFVDELYRAAIAGSEFFSQRELVAAPHDETTPEVVKLYQRVLSMGEETSDYAFVTMNDLHEVDRRLLELPAAPPRDSADAQNRYDSIAAAAAWQGDVKSMEMCLSLRRNFQTTKGANDFIHRTIHSHNRFGSFSDYRRIVVLNLEYLQQHAAPITCNPLYLLADDFLESYRYGETPDMPTMEHLLSLAELFLDYGVDINQREGEDDSQGTNASGEPVADPITAGTFARSSGPATSRGRTALAHAVHEGYAEYVDFLLKHGAKIHKDDPPDSNPVLLAQEHGFVEILKLLREAQGESEFELSKTLRIESVRPEDSATPATAAAPILMSPLSHTIIRLGSAEVEGRFEPRDTDGDTRNRFVEFPQPFPPDQFANVRLIITNRSHPRIIGSATTCMLDGRQGFVLKARNAVPIDGFPDGESSAIHGVQFSWMAVLPTVQPQPKRFAVRFGMIPWREYQGWELHEYTNTAHLYADAPFGDDVGEKFVFLTTTESTVVNGAAATADENGITDLTALQITRHDGGGRLYWMVIAECDASERSRTRKDLCGTGNSGDIDNHASTPRSPATSAASYFNSDDLWIHTDRAEPINFIAAGFPSAWRRGWIKFPCPLRERRPCTFVTSNSHGVDGHHSSVVAMIWNGVQTDLPITGLTIDSIRGQSNFDCFTIGHCDVPAEKVADANRKLEPTAPWEYLAGTDDEETAYELAASGRIGVNEFGPRGASLLTQAVYERHERMNTALARRLFALGADANQRHPITHMTPLHLAAFLNRKDMAHLLIERGADVNARTLAGTESQFPTPHDCARIRRDPVPPHRGETPLHIAMLQRCFYISRLLLKSGADPNAADSKGDRPIDYLPNWHTSPDHPIHWRLVNHRVTATPEDYEVVIKAILKEDESCDADDNS